jgi:hypothetical protein
MPHIDDTRLANFVRTIPLLTVPSSRSGSVRAVGYDEATAVLVVQLRKPAGSFDEHALHGYEKVSAAELEGLLTASSMRQFLEAVIEPNHDHVTVLDTALTT